MNDPVVDVNVNLGHWPARRVRGDEPAELVAMLRGQGVVEAWAGSFDGLIHKDVAAVNARLARTCRAQTGVKLVPFGTVNPVLPDWEDDLRRIAEEHAMPGIRLHPNYHGYALDHPALPRLLALAAGRRLVVALALAMEDERMMPPLLRVPQVDPAPLADLVAKAPGLRLVLLNALRTLRGPKLVGLIRAGEVFVEIATLEGVGGVAGVLKDVPAGRVLFGSHAPFYYPESAHLKLKESALEPAQLRALRLENARRLVPSRPPTADPP